MAWTIVETPNAKYVLMFSAHVQRIERSPLEFDALILEVGPAPKSAKDWTNFPQHAIKFSQYANLIGQATNGGKQVWLAVPTPTELTRIADRMRGVIFVGGTMGVGSAMHAMGTIKGSDALKAAGLGIAAMPLIHILTVPLQIHRGRIKRHKLWKIATKVTELLSARGLVEVRNAVAAENAESLIAPQLQKKLGRKPIIAISMGSGHYGVKRLLEQPERRRRFLAEHNLERYVSADSLRALRFEIDASGNTRNLKEFHFSAPKKELVLVKKEGRASGLGKRILKRIKRIK